MKRLKKEVHEKKILKESATLIYEEITQNLCLAKMTLAMTEITEAAALKENIKKTNDLVGKSIRQLRSIGKTLHEAEKIYDRHKT